MPGFLTHCIFGEQTVKRLDHTELKDILETHREVYMLGSQGPDIFFYNPLCHVLPGYRNTGVYMHANDTTGFFRNCLLHILREKEERIRNIWLAYTAGFIGHHYLDRTAHPYINWYTYLLKGNREENSFDIHSGIETNIDGAYAVKYKHMRPCSLPRRDLIGLSGFELRTVSDFLSKTLGDTYRQNKRRSLCFTPGWISFTIRGIQIGQDLLRDGTGRKKIMIGRIEEKLLPHPFLTGMVINDYQSEFGDYMNLAHREWSNPWNDREKSTASFPELFHTATIKCSETLRQLTSEYLWQSENAAEHIDRLMDMIGNRSYHSGLLYEK